METNQNRIRSYYARFPEWERLDTPEGALEFRRASSLLHANIPPRSRVLDLGGGPGRYSIELARAGHNVVLADLSPELLATARQRINDAGVLAGQVESVDEADAMSLQGYANDSFDAVVAFGPFYHLLSNAERVSAAGEIARVLRAGGLAFVAFIPRLSGLIGLVERAAASPDQVPEGVLSMAARHGWFRNGAESGFQEGYYPRVEDLREST